MHAARARVHAHTHARPHARAHARSSLLEWLLDGSFFARISDAVHRYGPFFLGLRSPEAKKVVGRMPPHVRRRLLRPGVIHLMPLPLQRALLPGGVVGCDGGEEGER